MATTNTTVLAFPLLLSNDDGGRNDEDDGVVPTKKEKKNCKTTVVRNSIKRKHGLTGRGEEELHLRNVLFIFVTTLFHPSTVPSSLHYFVLN